MLFWLISGAIALGITVLLARALLTARREGMLDAAESDIAVYKDQLREVDRDLARGVLSEAEARAVRTEVARRLLDADRRRGAAQRTGRGRALPAVVLVAIMLIAGSLALYSFVGAPGLRDMPLEARLAAIEAARASRPDQVSAEAAARDVLPAPGEVDPAFLDLMERLRKALETRPDDVRGLRLLAENEARLGNFAAARAAQERLVAVLGSDATPEEVERLLDLMVFAAGGFVSPEAEAVLHRLLADDPRSGAGRYYLGLMEAQAGRADRAFGIWRRLLEEGPETAPWIPVIRAEISRVAAAAGVDYQPPAPRGPSQADIAAAGAMSADDRQAMIRSMVAGLAERLADEGGPPEDWARLITSLGVLGETDRAAEIAAEAETVFADRPEALELIAAARKRASVGE